MSKYRFQQKNGYIADGNFDFKITDHIAIFPDELTKSNELIIEAHGGQLVETKSKPGKGKEKVKKNDSTDT